LHCHLPAAAIIYLRAAATGRATGLSVDQQDKLQSEIRQTEAELGKVNGQLKSYYMGMTQSAGFTAGLSNNVAGLVQNPAGAYYLCKA